MISSRSKLVYIACPYSTDPEEGVRRSMQMADDLIRAGFVPFNPLLSHFQHGAHPQDYEVWMAIDLNIIPRCDYLLRLAGASDGADREERFARLNAVPVVRSIAELKEMEG